MQPSELLDPVYPSIQLTQETYRWHPYEKFQPFFEKEEYYVTFTDMDKNRGCENDHPESPSQSPLDEDRDIFSNTPKLKPPYDPHLDAPLESTVFDIGFPGILSRETVINAEGFWGKWVFIYEDHEVKQYLKSNAVQDGITREEIRELVAALGTVIFEMVVVL
jgi:hypothetical protein